MASTARLLALADMVRTDPAQAEAELRRLAAEPRDADQRRAAGRASAAARQAQSARTKAAALSIAQVIRRAEPAASQEAVAASMKARFGALVPGEDGLRRWVHTWEVAGQLPARECAATGR